MSESDFRVPMRGGVWSLTGPYWGGGGEGWASGFLRWLQTPES